MHGSILGVTIPPLGDNPGDLPFFSFPGVLFPTLGHTKRDNTPFLGFSFTTNRAIKFCVKK